MRGVRVVPRFQAEGAAPDVWGRVILSRPELHVAAAVELDRGEVRRELMARLWSYPSVAATAAATGGPVVPERLTSPVIDGAKLR